MLRIKLKQNYQAIILLRLKKTIVYKFDSLILYYVLQYITVEFKLCLAHNEYCHE